jgi:hypothetical protein
MSRTFPKNIFKNLKPSKNSPQLLSRQSRRHRTSHRARPKTRARQRYLGVFTILLCGFALEKRPEANASGPIGLYFGGEDDILVLSNYSYLKVKTLFIIIAYESSLLLITTSTVCYSEAGDAALLKQCASSSTDTCAQGEPGVDLQLGAGGCGFALDGSTPPWIRRVPGDFLYVGNMPTRLRELEGLHALLTGSGENPPKSAPSPMDDEAMEDMIKGCDGDVGAGAFEWVPLRPTPDVSCTFNVWSRGCFSVTETASCCGDTRGCRNGEVRISATGCRRFSGCCRVSCCFFVSPRESAPGRDQPRREPDTARRANGKSRSRVATSRKAFPILETCGAPRSVVLVANQKAGGPIPHQYFEKLQPEVPPPTTRI